MQHVTPDALRAINERIKAMPPRYQMLVTGGDEGRTTALAMMIASATQAGMEVVCYAPDEDRRSSLADDLGASPEMIGGPVVTYLVGSPGDVHPSRLVARMLLVDGWSDLTQDERNVVGDLIDDLRPAITIVIKHSPHVPLDQYGREQMVILAATPTWLACSDVATQEPTSHFEFLPDHARLNQDVPWSWTHDAPNPLFPGTLSN